MTHLYQALLGSDWSLLAPVTRALHSPDSTVLFEGTVDIVRGSRPLAPLIAGILGLPKAGRQQPALVKVSKSGAGELLERWYDGRHFSTWQGRTAGLLTERFGPFGLSFRLRLANEVLHFDRQGLRCGEFDCQKPCRHESLRLNAAPVTGTFSMSRSACRWSD